MKTFHVKRGDEVTVISGSQKGKVGRLLSVDTLKERAVVEGLFLQKKHLKKSDQNPNGSIVEREGSIHLSNLMLKARYDERRSGRTKGN